MVPRLLDIEFLPLKPTNTLWKTDGNFRPRDGNFHPWDGNFRRSPSLIVYFVLRSVLMSASVNLDLDKTGTFI